MQKRIYCERCDRRNTVCRGNVHLWRVDFGNGESFLSPSLMRVVAARDQQASK